MTSTSQERARKVLIRLFDATNDMFSQLGISLEDPEHYQTSLINLVAAALDDVRRETIETCIKQLGGRYGAVATPDLRMLIEGESDARK